MLKEIASNNVKKGPSLSSFLIKHNKEHVSNITKSVLTEFIAAFKIFYCRKVWPSTESSLGLVLFYFHLVCQPPPLVRVKANSKLFTAHNRHQVPQNAGFFKTNV